MDDNYWRYPYWITVEEKNKSMLKVYFETFRYQASEKNNKSKMPHTIIGHTPGETT